jgi:isoleucyl-tRNA synthetase
VNSLESRINHPLIFLKTQEFGGKENAWKIWHADYVELGEEGTGAVHIAPAYGEEDMNLAKEHNIPIVHHVDHDGHFMPFVTDFAGKLVKPKDDDDAGVTHLEADIEIVKALKERGSLIRKKTSHTHTHIVGVVTHHS